MFPILQNDLINETKDSNSKSRFGRNIPDVVTDQMKLQLWNTYDTISSTSSYEIAQWTLGTKRWSENRSSGLNSITYKRGKILMIEWGGDNFGNEFSFSHPGVVLDGDQFFVLVVPGSSKKYGSGYREILDVPPTPTGFEKGTGLIMNQVRWVSKNRVTAPTRRYVDANTLKAIDRILLRSIPEHLIIVGDRDKRIEELEREAKTQANRITARDSRIAVLEAQLELLSKADGFKEAAAGEAASD